MTIHQALISVLVLFGTLASVWLGSWLTASRSHREWIRERTAQAYSTILEALFDMESWFSENIADEGRHREVDQETEQRRHEAYRAAKDRLDRTLAREEWLLPDSVKQVFVDMRGVFERRYDTWYEDLNASWGAVIKAKKRVIEQARQSVMDPHRFPLS